MTTAMRAVHRGPAADTALRLAVARGGRIEREWIVTEGRVTVGQADDADIVLPDHGATRETLFRIEAGATTLVIPVGAHGRLQLDGAARDASTLAGTSVVLDAAARGRLVLHGAGEHAVAILFQRIVAPEKRARPELPASVRGGLFDRVDWLFTALAAASFLLHLGVVVGLSSADWPMPPDLSQLDARVADIVFADATMPPMPDDPSDVSPTTPDEGPTTPSPDTEPTPTHATPTHATPIAHGDPRPAHVSDVEASLAVDHAVDQAIEQLIGATGPNGSLADLVRQGGPTTSAADILAQSRGTTIATADRPTMRDGHPIGLLDDQLDPRIHRTRAIEESAAPIVEQAPRRTRIQVEPIVDPVDPVVFDDALLRRAIRARMPQIQACYEHALTREPTLAGRLSVSMQVERIGTLSHVETVDDTVGSPALGQCVVRSLQTIRLAVGPTEPVTVEYPLVFAPQD